MTDIDTAPTYPPAVDSPPLAKALVLTLGFAACAGALVAAGVDHLLRK